MIKISSSHIHIKDPKTYEEQLTILKDRKLIIDNRDDALSTLKKVNYYRFSAYGLTLKDPKKKDDFQKGVTFSQIKNIYYFDKKLRETLIYYLESVEVEFRAKIAYYHSHQFDSLGYKDPDNFRDPNIHKVFLENLNERIDRSGSELFIKHHKNNYNGEFPFWVAIEVLSFGDLSRLFKNLLKRNQKEVIKDFNVYFLAVPQWLHSLSYLRNVCAHYGRLYGKDLMIKPPVNKKVLNNNRVFATIFYLSRLLHEEDRINLTNELKILIKEYSNNIDLNEIGFPSEWEDLLKK